MVTYNSTYFSRHALHLLNIIIAGTKFRVLPPNFLLYLLKTGANTAPRDGSIQSHHMVFRVAYNAPKQGPNVRTEF